VKTPSREIAWLDTRELHSMAVKTTGNVAQVTGSAAQPDRIADRTPPVQSETLASAPAQKIESRPAWNEFIEKMIALSSEQNKGAARLTRSCKPDAPECAMAVAYQLKDGRQALATMFQDANGNIKRREVCESDAANDLRDCFNWDTGAKYRDVKNTKGEWEQNLSY